MVRFERARKNDASDSTEKSEILKEEDIVKFIKSQKLRSLQDMFKEYVEGRIGMFNLSETSYRPKIIVSRS